MRPVTKSAWKMVNGEQKSYKPHTLAKSDLEDNLGTYCSYCEVFSSDLEVEHIISQDQDSTLKHNWDNFLVACGRCNGRDNKSNKHVDFSIMHFPHQNNTYFSFLYEEGGFVRVNPALNPTSFAHAEHLLNLVCIDKIPGSPKYPNLNPNDTRWRHRRTAWEYAKRYLADYELGNLTASQIVEFALQRGFFSVWYSVYINHQDVLKLLIDQFSGTAISCFDQANDYYPIARNPSNTTDPI